MIGWDDSIEINAKAADCYLKAVDLENCQAWIPQVEGIEKLYDGDIGVGSKWKETRKEGKRTHTMTLEVFESHSPKEGEGPYIHCAGAEMGGMKSYYRFIFEDAGSDKSKVRLEARVEPKNFIAKFFAKMAVKMMKKSDEGLLQRLKSYCEGS